MFAKSARAYRCLIPAVLYYEKGYQFWPVYADQKTPFFMAGVFRLLLGRPVPEFAVITRDAAPHIQHIHDRMPVILTKPDAAAWLAKDAPIMDLLAKAVLDVRFEEKSKVPKGPVQLSML
jgi:putative SOS response-associated peptidase YedK